MTFQAWKMVFLNPAVGYSHGGSCDMLSKWAKVTQWVWQMREAITPDRAV